jgi:RHS repeat-associated protein
LRLDVVAISGGASASFRYDHFGRRVSKTVGGTTQYLYDGVNPVQEISGSSASANLLTGGVDEYFQRTDSAGVRNFLTDALGSTLALADSTGSLQTQYTFEPFGNTSVVGAATTNSFAYTGRELDATGLYFYRARYYSPSLQRFITEDPIGFRAGVNKYLYAVNGPANFVDPMGLDKKGAGPGNDQPSPDCETPSLFPHSAGLIAGGEATVGVVATGASVQANGGLYLSTTGDSGFFVANSTFANLGSKYSASNPQNDTPNAVGAYAGLGVGIMLSNATNGSQLAGPFDQITLSLPAVSVSAAYANGIWQVNVTGGPGMIFGITRSTSNTNMLFHDHWCGGERYRGRW